MTLYLVRHAAAADRGPEWPDDARRPLTDRGRNRMRRAVKGLRALGVRPDLVATSPLVRAAQTAALLVASLEPTPEQAVVPALVPGKTPQLAAQALARLTKVSSLMAVGHEPDLGKLAAWLLGTRTPIPFKKGGVCCVEVDDVTRPGGGTLVWMATPRMLRSAGD